MTVKEAIALIKNASFDKAEPQLWADLGCGNGIFSQALAHLLPRESRILCLDKRQQNIGQPIVQGAQLEFRKVNFVEEPLPLTNIHGILMANSLHYVVDKARLIQDLKHHLTGDGKFIIVEYDTEKANPWVPYPISFRNLERVFFQSGFTQIRKVGERESIYGPKLMYACEISP